MPAHTTPTGKGPLGQILHLYGARAGQVVLGGSGRRWEALGGAGKHAAAPARKQSCLSANSILHIQEGSTQVSPLHAFSSRPSAQGLPKITLGA